MEFPQLSEVRGDLSKIAENLDFLVEYVSTNSNVTFSGFHAHSHTINMELIQTWNKITPLEVADKRYRELSEKLRKILWRLTVELSDIERKHVEKNRVILWEEIFQEGKLRKDLINHFKDVSKQLRKTQESI